MHFSARYAARHLRVARPAGSAGAGISGRNLGGAKLAELRAPIMADVMLFTSPTDFRA
jgi:hypothetical protein